jgi:hypothetical protein
LLQDLNKDDLAKSDKYIVEYLPKIGEILDRYDQDFIKKVSRQISIFLFYLRPKIKVTKSFEKKFQY